jgi:hypothetical protein
MSTSSTMPLGLITGEAALGIWMLTSDRERAPHTRASMMPAIQTIRMERRNALPGDEFVLLMWPQTVAFRGMAQTPVEEWTAIFGSLGGGYCLQEPVEVHVWADNEEYIADAPGLNLHAFGADREEALLSLRERIVEEFEFLRSEADAGRLAPRMAVIYAALARALNQPGG